MNDESAGIVAPPPLCKLYDTECFQATAPQHSMFYQVYCSAIAYRTTLLLGQDYYYTTTVEQ